MKGCQGGRFTGDQVFVASREVAEIERDRSNGCCDEVIECFVPRMMKNDIRSITGSFAGLFDSDGLEIESDNAAIFAHAV